MKQTPTQAVAAAVRARAAYRMVRQPELAKALGLNQQQISRRMLGQTPFTVVELTRVAQVLDVPVAELIAGADVKSGEVPA